MNKSDNKITVIIPNYNNQKLLANLLESLKQVTLPHDIIIVDNASSDNSTTYIKTNFPEITLIENKHWFCSCCKSGNKNCYNRLCVTSK